MLTLKKFSAKIRTNIQIRKIKKFFKKDKFYHEKIKSLKNTFNGGRCFLIGNGPSLTFEDLDIIKNEYSFSSNKIYKIFDKTVWRPYFYIIADQTFCSSIDALSVPAKMRFIGLESNSNPIDMYKNHKDEVILYQKKTLVDSKGYPILETKCDDYVTAGHTVLFEAFSLAIYLGFDEIVLLGVDCDYQLSGTHFYASETTNYDYSNTADEMMMAWLTIKNYAETNGIKVYNASRGGKLDFFERVKLEDIVKN